MAASRDTDPTEVPLMKMKFWAKTPLRCGKYKWIFISRMFASKLMIILKRYHRGGSDPDTIFGSSANEPRNSSRSVLTQAKGRLDNYWQNHHQKNKRTLFPHSGLGWWVFLYRLWNKINKSCLRALMFSYSLYRPLNYLNSVHWESERSGLSGVPNLHMCSSRLDWSLYEKQKM